MRFERISGIFAIILLSISGCSLLGPFEPPPPTDPVTAIRNGELQLHSQVRQALQQAAQVMNISIQLETFVYASRDDFIAASALVSSFDSLVFEDQTNRVADLGLVFLSLPPAANIPDGFYKVRAFIIQSRVELLDMTGQPVISLPLERLGYVEGSSKPMMMVSGCDVTIPYNQIRQPANAQTVQVAVRFSWCERLVR